MTPGVTIEKLKIRLDRAGVDPMNYSIGRRADDQYCIEQSDDGSWMTYFGERGQKTNVMMWQDEGDACISLLGQLAWDDLRS